LARRASRRRSDTSALVEVRLVVDEAQGRLERVSRRVAIAATLVDGAELAQGPQP